MNDGGSRLKFQKFNTWIRSPAIMVTALLSVLVVIALLGWSSTRFTRINACTVCHEIFVDYDEYAPAGELSKSVEDYKPIEAFDHGWFNVTVGCAECHAYPYEEYKESAHYDNERDVKAGCVGCHEPHSVYQILNWKFFYLNTGSLGESPFHAISNGLRDIPAWEELRIELAKRVRVDMVAEKSEKCKNCHKPESEWFKSKESHVNNKGVKTCVQCHYNITHKDVKWHKE